MKEIDMLFNRLDTWRHLPSYQLERRADIFFSLYLSEVLEKKLGFQVLVDLIPEFPVHIETIYKKKTDKSYKIDYIAFSKALDKAVFVELKTDYSSRRPGQDKYLCKAREVGLSKLLGGLKKIFIATTAKRKYFCLFEQLERFGVVFIPERIKVIMNRPNLQGINELVKGIESLKVPEEIHLVYVQPNHMTEEICAYEYGKSGYKPVVITFKEFSEVVKSHGDPISKRFAKSLDVWVSVKAGDNH